MKKSTVSSAPLPQHRLGISTSIRHAVTTFQQHSCLCSENRGESRTKYRILERMLLYSNRISPILENSADRNMNGFRYWVRQTDNI